MGNSSIESERQELLAQLNAAKAEYHRCVSDVDADTAYRGSEWSIVDLLNHVIGSYDGMVDRLLSEDNPNLAGAYDANASWKRRCEALLGEIDSHIAIASDLTAEQLGRTGTFGKNTIRVMDMLTRIARHYDEHLAQLRDEVRPRENLA